MNVFRHGWPLLAVGLALVAGCGSAAARTSTAGPPPSAPACPARSGQATPRGGSASGPFVPGRPIVLTVCRYAGVNAPQDPRALTATRVLRGRALSTVRTALNAQPKATGTYACPADDGAAHLLLFGYRDGSVVRVRVGDSGCRFADNGRRRVRTPPTLTRRLG